MWVNNPAVVMLRVIAYTRCMKALYATFRALPGCEDRLRQLVMDLTGAVRAEPGCRVFIPFTRADDPRAWHVHEVYADEAAFQAHIGSAHGRAFNAAITGLVEGGASSVVFLEPVCPPA
jgi:quinol monooxygenase YgiN